MDHILYQIFKIILSIFKKKHGENTDNLSVRMYVNKIENKITFKTKTGYNLELLTPEAMKLLGSIVILPITIINKIQESCRHLFQTRHLVAY